jgi:broad specificity phosphatase PhoE
MTTFYLVRHGETEWNLQRRWQGLADVPLNEQGLAQARKLANRFSQEHLSIHALYSSDLKRAHDTALIIGSALNLQPNILPTLREFDVGTWSGKLHHQISNDDLFSRMQSGEDVRRGGDGERFADVYDRAVSTLEHLSQKHPKQRVMLVSHGGTLQAMLLHAARNKVNALPRPLHIGNTSLSILHYAQGHWEIELVNDQSHLQAGDFIAQPVSAGGQNKFSSEL